MSETKKRSLRTLLQVGTVSAIIGLLVAFGVDLSGKQIEAIQSLGTILVVFLHNLLEDKEVVPTLLK